MNHLQRYPDPGTGSSGSRPRMMYIRVFSIMAKRSGLSEAHRMSQTSFRSNGMRSPAAPAATRVSLQLQQGLPIPVGTAAVSRDSPAGPCAVIPVAPASMSKKVRMPLMSMIESLVEVQLILKACTQPEVVRAMERIAPQNRGDLGHCVGRQSMLCVCVCACGGGAPHSIRCGRQRSWYVASTVMCGSEYRTATPDCRPTIRQLAEAATQQIGSAEG